MKKKNLLLSAITLLATMTLLFTSCTKENIDLNPDSGETITLMASTETDGSADTKTTLGGDPLTEVHWTYDAESAADCDKIRVYTGSSNGEFTVSGLDANTKTKATFSGTSLDATLTSAIYPASMAYSKDEDDDITYPENTITLPNTQVYAEGNVADGVMPMYASIASDEQGTLSFKNICGILKLQITGEGNVVGISVNSEDKIAGKATISLDDNGLPELAWDATATNSIVLDCRGGGDGVALSSTAKVFYIVVPPTTSQKFNIKVALKDGKGMSKTTQENALNVFNRNEIKTMTSIDFTENADYNNDEYGQNRGKGIAILGGTANNLSLAIWAPVNCGYQPENEVSSGHKGYTYGKLYQWGRKDGQGYDDASDAKPDIVSGPCPSETVPLENTFYKYNFPYNWTESPCGDTDNENAWNDWTRTLSEEDGKVGNPCPEGWRVPTADELTALFGGATPPNPLVAHDEQKGAWFNGTNNSGTSGVFFPAAGYRYGDTGAEINRGSFGSYWSSTIEFSYAYVAYCLDFNGGVANMTENGRSLGCSVRCVLN